jgi:hypothetical protein
MGIRWLGAVRMWGGVQQGETDRGRARHCQSGGTLTLPGEHAVLALQALGEPSAGSQVHVAVLQVSVGLHMPQNTVTGGGVRGAFGGSSVSA